MIKLLLLLTMLLPMSESAQVCSDGIVKYEAGQGYEYGYEYGSINILPTDPQIVTWTASFDVNSVCVKVGGPDGGELYYPDPGLGEWVNTSGYDVSHVVLSGSPTQVGLGRLSASNAGASVAALLLLLALVIAGAVIPLMWGRDV